MISYLAEQIIASIRSINANISGMPACDERELLIGEFLSAAERLRKIKDGCNTRLNYLYRDASNYKTHNSVVLSGIMTENLFRAIKSCCEGDDEVRQFIPEQVGLDLKRNWEINEDDHPYAELEDYELVVDVPTCDMTVEELVEKFRDAKDEWRPEDYMPKPDYYNAEEDED